MRSSRPRNGSRPITLESLRKALIQRERERDLMQFIPMVSPRFTAPLHMAAYVDVLQRAARERVFIVVNAPPRHAKTETTLHFIVQCLKLIPGIRIAYASYAADFSFKQSNKVAEYARRAGLTFSVKRQELWVADNGSEAYWTSIGGPLTGYGVDLLIVDDPVKDRAQAESPLIRDRAYDWFNDVAFTRLEGRISGSAVVMQTRWHHDDLAGRLIAQGWDNINLQAINDKGEPLWPEQKPLKELEEIRKQIGEYSWASLYQGQPIPRGASVFGEPTYYDELPKNGVRISIGADFAYTSKTYSDYTAAVVLYEHQGSYYVADVWRDRIEIAKAKPRIMAMQAKHPGKITAFVAATEEGVIEFLKSDRNGTTGRLTNVQSVRATTDKFTRAQPVAAAWEAGRVLVPRNAPWLGAFLQELQLFTGLGDKHDDQVDALAGAFHPFAGAPNRRTVHDDSSFTFG